MKSVSRVLADAYSSTKFADLPSNVVEDARRAVLDWLGSAMAGAFEPPAQMTHRVVARLGASNEATVFNAERSSAAGAALANGVASHILELDDVHKGSTMHAGAPVISAALAVAEREGADGRAFLLAVTLGYDAALRIGEAVNPSHYHFWHPTGTAATFGAAVAAASLMSATAETMQHSLGTAGTQAAGLWEFNADGTMSKHLHPGKAAFNGVLAADLAAEGFTGAGRILEGERGFIRAMSDARDTAAITEHLGSHWKISENCFKVWACCGHTHSAIDVALELNRARHHSGNAVAPSTDIKSIAIDTYGPGYEIVNERNPGTPYAAKFSLAYCVAAALTYGGAPLEVFSADHFADGRVCDPEIEALLRRTTVTVADDLTNKYPRAWPTRLRITFANDTTLQGASDYPVGNPENPVTTEQLEEKFSRLVLPRWGKSVAERALAAVRSLETCRDTSELFRDMIPDSRAVPTG